MAKKAKTESLEIRYVAVDDLKPWPANPRKHAEDIEAVKASIEHFGWTNPLLVQAGTARIIAGHGRLEAAKRAGISEVPVIELDMTDLNATAYTIADNRLAELSAWDADALGPIVLDLEAEGFDVALTGFDEDGLAEILPTEKPEIEEDEIPEPPADPITKPGDLWVMGGHRLLCGDSTKEGDVGRVFGDERSGLMNTDPPYGVSYANEDRPNPGVAKPRVAKDDLSDEKLQAFLEAAFTSAVSHALVPSAAWYMWHAHLTQGFFASAAAAAADVLLHRQIIWVKPVLLLTRGDYHWKHEPCFYGWVRGNRPPDYGRGGGERDQTTIWEIDGVKHDERKEWNHATPKPVALFEIPIIKHLKRGEIAFEPFAGTGPQFIAAEKLNRRCYGIEISPAYCDVIVERWEALTGGKAKRG